jgi:hypothetical protein
MTFEFVRRPERSPLPGAPVPYFLTDGDGEHAVVIDSLFTVLLSADETAGRAVRGADPRPGDRLRQAYIRRLSGYSGPG